MDLVDKIKIAFYEKDGDEFEKFAVATYKIDYPQLLAIKPQGQRGDGANDGYMSGKLLIQVYAPEVVDAKKAIAKINHDFYRAINCGWDFKEWHFIINDKFKTLARDIHHEIDKLQKITKTIKSNLLIAKH